MSETIPTGVPGFDELVGGLPKGGLVILAGGPGTGKTMFSASFLYWGAVKYGEKGMYVSLSEDKTTFMANMRKIGLDFEKLEKDGLFKFVDALTLMESGTSPLFETILEDAMTFQAQRLVIDSLTALAQGFKSSRELRVFLHTLLSRIMKNMGCTTILIEEVPLGREWIGYGFEEFVASTVILLEILTMEDKLLRRLHIAKMRGAKILNPKACFTLAEGFKAYPPFKFRKPESLKPYQVLPDPPERHSTGIPDLDKIIGGYPKSSTILLEISPKLSREDYQILIAPTIINSVLKGKPVVIIPPIGAGPDDLGRVCDLYGVPQEKRETLLRVFLRKELLEGRKILKYQVPYERKTLEEDMSSILSVAENLIKSSENPLVQVLAIDTVGMYHGQLGVLRAAQESITLCKRTGGFALWVAESTFPDLLQKLSPLASMHFKLTGKHGCLLFYGIKPRTPLIAIEEDLTKGYPLPKLTPIL